METWPFGASPTSILSTERSAILSQVTIIFVYPHCWMARSSGVESVQCMKFLDVLEFKIKVLTISNSRVVSLDLSLNSYNTNGPPGFDCL